MKPNVLVAGPTISEVLHIQGWLAGLDCRLVVAETGREVMRATRNRDLDLLILDTALPDVEGQKLIPLLREVDPTLPIIVTTGDHSPDLEQAVRRCEVVFYAIRPDDLPHLEGIVRKNLDSTGGR